jgi:hypothetical protein
MNYITVKDAIVQLLWNNQGTDFRTLGYQQQTKSSKEFKNDNRLVEVLYVEGEFPASSGSNQYSSKHGLRFNIEFSVSAAAEGDIETATDPAKSAAERAAAIADIREASNKVDSQLDELISRVYQILMDASNRDFGLNVGTVSSRRVSRIRKDDTIEDGTLVTKTGMMELTCQTIEEVSGYVDPNPGSAKTIDTEIDIQDDDVQKTGVETITEV